ncbi:MAG: rhodanese-like domain-containing protein [Chloroflexi bacterium]|nr:rhodanese-like domain-containing protein [Chloroflexota bacterium]
MNFLKAIFGGSTNSLSAGEAKELIGGGKPPFILDVRQPDEYRGGHIASAKLIPLNDLAARMHELPKDREILCVCRSGARSGMAAGQLAAAGYSAVNLRGGMMSWQGSGFPVKQGK